MAPQRRRPTVDLDQCRANDMEASSSEAGGSLTKRELSPLFVGYRTDEVEQSGP
jgi:hypothetical protein